MPHDVNPYPHSDRSFGQYYVTLALDHPLVKAGGLVWVEYDNGDRIKMSLTMAQDKTRQHVKRIIKCPIVLQDQTSVTYDMKWIDQ